MRSFFLRDGGLYYYMQQRMHNMHLVYPLFGMVRAYHSCVSKPRAIRIFPRFSKNLKKVDSSECCVKPRKPLKKHHKARLHNLPRCVRASSVHGQRRFEDSPCFERNCEDQRECRLCHREKMYIRSGECRNMRRCMEKNRETSQICSKQIERLNSYESHDSLNKKYNTNTDLKTDKSE